MLRMMTAIAAGALALTAPLAAAESYTDAESNFRITIPDGWQNDHDTDESIRLSLLSPRFKETRGLCGVLTMAQPETRGKSQAELDADGDRSFGEEFWIKAMQGADTVKAVAIDGRGVRMVNGHKAYFMVATIDPKASADGPKIKTQQMIEVIPGQFFLIMCMSKADSFDKEEADFTALMNSFAPISDAPVAMREPNGVTSLTMYSLPRYGGVSRVVTQDAANLAEFGWHGTTASLSVAGTGAWEVCEGANFTGRCETVTTSLPTGLGGKTFAVASARHITALLPPSQAAHADPQADVTLAVERLLAH